MDRALLPITSYPPWSRAVAETVIELEDSDEIRPILLYIFDTDEKTELLTVTDGREPSMDDLVRSKSSLLAAEETLEAAGFGIDVRGVEAEDRGAAILETARNEDIDRIYLFNRKRSPVGKAVYGSAVQRVLANAAVPVVVLPSETV
jgi:nucleotide-binding universal stress UspA family protein